ncbi:ORF6N domain-containing protein [Parabacteroides bouchesdurhonensis]|uniref:ORF6N domain-containing protein n=1 Tax=Parabacteroides bouchesdurhonensis TaxID=1936995 RepID=UPI001D0C6C9F|nr:ORF6N domain-containing protein [Parabacteroides bouchesdurhonensis]
MKKEIVQFQEVEDLIIQLRGQRVLLDRDVATLCGVETRDINKSVRNNPDKFPIGYCFNLQFAEKQYVVGNFHRFQSLKGTKRPDAEKQRTYCRFTGRQIENNRF